MADLMQDPYLSSKTNIERLWGEYLLHKKLVIAFDYDNTIFDYHSKGFTFPKVLDLLRRSREAGFYLLLFTAAPTSDYTKILNHLSNDLSLVPESINKNVVKMPIGNDGKPFYNILLDDRAGLGQACEVLEAVLDKIDHAEGMDAAN